MVLTGWAYNQAVISGMFVKVATGGFSPPFDESSVGQAVIAKLIAAIMAIPMSGIFDTLIVFFM
jgi:hypothetical protein